ncbi:cyclic nucleotide-binding domain-containing protein [Niveispirillum sp.]|uniref:cyclic nucleotide-binding domain-containing protein n=1 Tax=Niveispirillum sp. TaxID=1917217 RepID=UPI001B50CF91|nr:cyclic nucleotide-binding domain-containing protein [Niveispirillum sp.]MBP7338843.1 cyclic nucleotide-binding domain-containing protein [Niveispirillum sp.]
MLTSLTAQVEALRRLPLFKDVETAQLKLLAFTSETARFKDGDKLFRQDEPSDAAYVILAGRIDMVIETPSGPINLGTFAGAGIIGEVSILCDRPRMATAFAVGEVDTLRIGRDAFFRLMEEFPRIALPMLRDVARRLEFMTLELSRARA